MKAIYKVTKNKLLQISGFILIGLLINVAIAQAKSASTAPASFSSTQPASQPDSNKLMKKLVAIDKRAAKVKDLTAEFIQKKYTPLLKKPLKSSGKVFVKPPVILWVNKSKNKFKMRVDRKTLRIFYIKQNIEEIYPVNSNLAALTSSPIPRLKSLIKMFDFSKGKTKGLNIPKKTKTLTVRLNPKSKKLSKHVDHVRVVLDINRGLMLVMEITGPDGGRTVMRFLSIDTNTHLKDKQLKLDAPKDVKIIYPLKEEKDDSNSKESKG